MYLVTRSVNKFCSHWTKIQINDILGTYKNAEENQTEAKSKKKLINKYGVCLPYCSGNIVRIEMG